MSSSQSVSHDLRPAPSTLAEMQSMQYKDFRQVEKYLFDSSGNVCIKDVIWHLVELADEELYWRGEEEANSIREFWYNPAKPILKRAFPDNDGLDDRLSTELSNMVEEGKVSYRGLGIKDDSREREVSVGTVESDKILFVEKDAAYRKLKPLHRVYGFTLVSGAGQPSRACTSDISDQLDSSKSYDLFVLADYDPTGFSIGNSFKTQCIDFGIGIKNFRRIGIYPEQLDIETIARHKYIPKGDKEWIEEHGIEGKYGLELEAIGDLNEKGKALREVVVNELRPHLREEERIRSDVEEANRTLPALAADNLVYELRVELEKEAQKIQEEKGISANPYPAKKLHQAAIEDDNEPSPPRVKANNQLIEEMKEKISTGQIPVEELL